MAYFDYEVSAEVYPSRRYAKTSKQRYRRFGNAAEAIQFMIEIVSSPSLAGSFLEVDERRYEGEAIRALYDADEYPLLRRKIAA
ncbi:hypothetical protein [Devosia sp. A16]|uniref:hypothetical protein n=1 Tax=Devosia sp. A16 TaxID=1736675 RepID=UPI0006D851A8|nr:hypothetical protein [Devosia sp. A16]